MLPIVAELRTRHSPESLARQLLDEPRLVLLRTGTISQGQGRFSFVAARPFLRFTSKGNKCIVAGERGEMEQWGDPWQILRDLASRFDLHEDLPFPVGGCFGSWGYDLKNHLEPKLPRSAIDNLGLPDCSLGFYDSLVVFDHLFDKVWVVSTGFQADGSRCAKFARPRLDWWKAQLEREVPAGREITDVSLKTAPRVSVRPAPLRSSIGREDFIDRVQRAKAYIRSGDIYQVNLAHRLQADWHLTGWELFECLSGISPAPFSAYLDCGGFNLVSSSPELFLRLSGQSILTRPIKGTRPRSNDPTRDTQLAFELQRSPKEMAELIMITDLLRNDLGKVSEFGSVHVPEVFCLERYAHVQHLVSTIEGRLRPDLTHVDALAACFPGGSITGAPKFRAMEIIDELEPVTRGPYTGAIGYLGFNRESQLNISIRTAVYSNGRAWFHTGAGIVADSVPDAEYDETLAKAEGFLQSIATASRPSQVPR